MKKRKSKKSVSAKVSSGWPLKRNVLERPDRLLYVRKLLPEQGCIFCNAENAKISVESLCLFKSKTALVMMNKYPYNTGHLLLVPRRHIGNLWDLSPAENVEIAEWIQKSVVVLRDVFKCDGFNIGLNHGLVSGAGIPDHLHWHVIPRWQGDTNFFPLIAETKVLPETLEQTYNKLMGRFA